VKKDTTTLLTALASGLAVGLVIFFVVNGPALAATGFGGLVGVVILHHFNYGKGD